MTEKAIELLSQNKNGYFLFVEGFDFIYSYLISINYTLKYFKMNKISQLKVVASIMVNYNILFKLNSILFELI
jgi:hypothetical protein